MSIQCPRILIGGFVKGTITEDSFPDVENQLILVVAEEE
jgi:hypothetical protein